MFNSIKEYFAKKKIERDKITIQKMTAMSNILFILYSSLLTMKSIAPQEQIDTYKMYVALLYSFMKDEYKPLLLSSVKDTEEQIKQLSKKLTSKSEAEIREQISKIFNQ
jgi:hypothetical protein